jgi:hypothetical protein
MDLKNLKKMLNVNHKNFNKNFIAIILLMLFWILLLNTYTFNQFTNTILGRFIMILIIIGVSCVNKMFGIICVLSIFAFLNLKKTHAEGFDDNTTTYNNDDDDDDNTINSEMDNITVTIKQHKKNKKIIKNNIDSPILTDDINDDINDDVDDINNDDDVDDINDNVSETDANNTDDTNDKTEGFDILSLERILFGKSKDKININNKNNKKPKNVLPANANNLPNNYK